MFLFLIYGIHIYLLYLLLFVSLGIIMMFGFGLAIGGWAKNENQAAPLSNLIAFPMMFLSGAFFPRFLMPEWLQSASTILPLTPLVEGIRMIITESKTIIDIAPQIGLMSMWTIVIYIIAFKVFRWEWRVSMYACTSCPSSHTYINCGIIYIWRLFKGIKNYAKC